MPQCRFLIASMLWKEAQILAKREPRTKADDDAILDLLLGARPKPNDPRKGNGALNHFINVFSLYPESQWAMDAVDEAEEERFGQKINIPINEEVRQKIRVSHFVDAKTAQQEQQYKKAVELFESFLHRYAESREGVSAHSQLAQIYAELYQRNRGRGGKGMVRHAH
jgi:outer membrane protein assembly factor BamD (BamD/ComL family)